jgi:hypothetical protein
VVLLLKNAGAFTVQTNGEVLPVWVADNIKSFEDFRCAHDFFVFRCLTRQHLPFSDSDKALILWKMPKNEKNIHLEQLTSLGRKLELFLVANKKLFLPFTRSSSLPVVVFSTSDTPFAADHCGAGISQIYHDEGCLY